MSRRLRWLLLPVVLLVSLFVPGLIVAALNRLAPHYGLEPTIPFDWLDGSANGVGAFIWVFLGAGLAPRHRRVLSVGLFVVGAWIANAVLGGWFWPENHARAYQPSVVPLRVTLACGAVGVCWIWWREWRITRSAADSVALPSEATGVPEGAA